MGPAPARRTALPAAQQKNDTSNLLSLMWSILKDSLGKDLTKITLPFFFNEPLSVLQKFVEDLEFAELLNKVSTKVLPHPIIYNMSQRQQLFTADIGRPLYTCTWQQADAFICRSAALVDLLGI